MFHERRMVRIMLSLAGALAACTPAPREVAIHSPSPDPGIDVQGPKDAAPEGHAPRASDSTQRAARGPTAESVSAAENPAPAPRADSAAEASGRRTLSTAFVMVGPDGRLTVELRNGRVLVLRDVIMGVREFCGVQEGDAAPGKRFCGGYAQVRAARPGIASAPQEPDLSVPHSAAPLRSPAKRD